MTSHRVARALNAAGNALKAHHPKSPSVFRTMLFTEDGKLIAPASSHNLLAQLVAHPQPLLKLAQQTQNPFYHRMQLPGPGTYWLVWGNGTHGGLMIIRASERSLSVLPWMVAYARITSSKQPGNPLERFYAEITGGLGLTSWRSTSIPMAVEAIIQQVAPELVPILWPNEGQSLGLYTPRA